MQFSHETIILFLSQLWWPIPRISGLFLAMPIISSAMMPMRIRVIFALVLAFLISPAIPASLTLLNFQPIYVLYVADELLLGLLMGFVLQLVFQVFILGGQVVAMQAGLGFATMVDPASKASVPLISQFYLMLVTLTFMALNGHLAILDALLGSFQQLPPGQMHVNVSAIGSVLTFSGWMFKEAVLVALPAISALLIVSVSFGVMTRVAPQLNIFSLGFPMTLLMGMVIISISLPGVAAQIADSLEQGMLLIKGLLH